MCIPLQSGIAKNECRAHAREISASMCSAFFVIRRLSQSPSAISATYPLHRTIALRTTECLSAAPDEIPPNHRRPIRRSRRKPAELQNTYPPLQTKALRTREGLSVVPDDCPQQFLRPIGRCWLLLIIDAFYAGRDGGEYLVGDRSETFGHLRYG